MQHKLSEQLFERAKKVIPGGVNSPVRAFGSVGMSPFVVARGEGPYLFDVDGNRYVDYICSWGPLVLGHAHPLVVEAIKKQAERGTSFGACAELETEMAELIVKLMPSIEMVRFVSSGTEACMSVLRLARAFTKRNKIIKFSGCYHGHADSLLVQAGSGIATLGLPGTAGVPNNMTEDTLTAPFNDLESVRKLFETFPDKIAAIILEPVVGNSGLILPQAGYLSGLREICSKFGALLIFDEVMTGFRVHLGGAQALFNIKPDLTTLGKVIGGGLPVGAYGGRKEIMQMIAPSGPVYQAGTLSGNPLALAAGIATLKEWNKAETFERTAGYATEIVNAFRASARTRGVALTAESVGTMFGLFYSDKAVHNFDDAKCSDVERFKRFFRDALNSGVYFAPSAFEAGFVSSAHAGEALERTLEVISQSL